MKRMHIHVGVENLEDAIEFYSALFGEEPSKVKGDYAKWMLEDPRVNFAISLKAGRAGVNHLGLQVDGKEELEVIRSQLSAANISTHKNGETTCCYARSEKSWVEDPAGIPWEAYRSMEDVEVFSEEPRACGMTKPETSTGGCC